MSRIHLCCAAEGGYVAHSAAMIHSALLQSPRGAVVHYLHDPALAEESRKRLGAMVSELGADVDFIAIPDERLGALPTEGFTRKATWYRIFLPELLPDLDRILYLDADLIALRELAPLWETDLAGHLVAAVTNVIQPHYARWLTEAGFDLTRYFNAGVLLMNLAEMRRDRSSEKLFTYGTERADRLVLRDQDALNAVLGEGRLALPPRWNCMNALFVLPQSADVFDADELREARRNPAIRHFEGPDDNKPWHYFGDAAAREAYDSHRRETPWPRYRRTGMTPVNIAASLSRRLGRKPRFTPAPLRAPR